MRIIFGILLILGGIALGLWLGVWVCFIGGIVQIVRSCQAHPVSGLGIAFGWIRFCCSALAGWGSFSVCAFAGSLCFIPSHQRGLRR
jgi:hypothetical protein